MFCENCGKENLDSDKFCDKCGNTLAEDINVPVASIKISKKFKIIYSILFVLFVSEYLIYDSNNELGAEIRHMVNSNNSIRNSISDIKQERQERASREQEERRARNSARQGQENKRRRDDFCYSLSSSSAREACLGNAYATNSEDARNITLGNCYALNNTAMTQVCVNGKQGCYSFNNSDVMNACVQCGGSNRWLRTYAAGSLFNCY